ncbi:MAG: 5,6-dimethylbenzimidazole synthase [Isosphaeraceae bacterium]
MNVYEAIHTRRDVRRFRPDPVPDDVLLRILDAAHHAGSVGYMQPWNFLVVRSTEVRRTIFEVFERENARAAEGYSGERRALYDSLKLQGILDAPLNIAVTCDRTRGGPHVLGRNTVLDADLYSTCCAVQNLWLAARAEGVGVGWVSILDTAIVQRLLDIPQGVLMTAYLCVGYPVEFEDKPLLEKVGWAEKIPLRELVFEDSWGRKSETLFRD